MTRALYHPAVDPATLTSAGHRRPSSPRCCSRGLRQHDRSPCAWPHVLSCDMLLEADRDFGSCVTRRLPGCGSW